MRPLSLLPLACLAVVSCHASDRKQTSQGETASSSPLTESDGSKGIHRDRKGKPAPGVTFNGPDQRPVKLSDFAGKPVLVNFWASWCAPCVKELPKLDTLAKVGSVQILAISQDSGPHASVVAFLQGHRIIILKSYQDPNMALAGALGAEVLPTSVLFDSKGREVWRYVGDFDWTGSEATKLLAEAGAAPRKV